MDTSNKVERLIEIQDEMQQLLREAEQLLRGTSEEGRAHSYWAAHIKCALSDDHSYLGSSMCTMQDTIDALAVGAYTDEESEGGAA